MVVGRPELHPLDEKSLTAFKDAQVPSIGIESCAGCEHEDTCNDDFEWPFSVDMSGSLLDSVKPYKRLVVCSTGKTDWAHDVSGESGTLAHYLKDAYSHRSKENEQHEEKHHRNGSGSGNGLMKKISSWKPFGGDSNTFFNSTFADKFTILNGSLISPSHDPNLQSVLVFPDYKIVHNIPNSLAGAQNLVKNHVSPSCPAWTSTPLPYLATVLICSHKKRDKRCHLAAPVLIDELARCCAEEGWDIDERGDFDVEDEDEKVDKDSFQKSLHNVSDSLTPTVGVFKVSHFGGHKYAGNMVICLPNGANIWYGRVTRREVPAIVQQTIKEGKIIRELLRAAGNINGKSNSILDW